MAPRTQVAAAYMMYQIFEMFDRDSNFQNNMHQIFEIQTIAHRSVPWSY